MKMVRMIRKKPHQVLIAAVLLLLVWMVFVPIQLGGPVSYIIISGNSMEPEIHLGDLVVARRRDHYQLDQRVIYDHPQLGYVFHRIVGQEGDQFILQGDNNDWLDTYQPTKSEILGKYWYDIPGAGKVISALQQPLYFTLFVLIISSLLVGLVLTPDPGPTRKRKGKRKRMNKDHTPPSVDDFRLEILLILAVIAAVALIFGLIAFTKDSKIIVTDDLPYLHTVELSYSAEASSAIYDSPGVETGDPVYPALSCVVDLGFDYQFSSPRLNGEGQDQFAGSVSLGAEIRDNDGWHRTIILLPEVDISSQKVNAQPSLNICQILDLIRDKEAQTGVFLNTYTLSIMPAIKIEGELEGLAFTDEFQPEFPFDLSEAVLRVPHTSEGFLLEQEGKIPHMMEIDNQMSLFGRQVAVNGVRWTAGIILGICVLGAIYPAWSLLGDWNKSQRARIEIQHRPVMIDLKDSQIRKAVYTVIDLERMADLRKLADRYGAMIMHEMEGALHRYFVIDEDFLYQFETEEESEIFSPTDDDSEGPVIDVWEDA